MIPKDLKTKILGSLGAMLACEGFSEKPIGQSFRRKFLEGMQTCHVAFIPHKSDIDFTLDVAISFEKAAELFKRCRHGLKTKSETFVLGVELGNFSHGEPRRFNVETAQDVERATKDAFLFFKEQGELFLARNSNSDSAIAILSSDSAEAWLYSPLHGQRAVSAIAMVAAYHGLDAALAVAERKRKFLNSIDDEIGLKKIQNFVDCLTNY